MKLLVSRIATIAVFLFVSSTAAYAQSTSVGVRASTLGISLEVERSFSATVGGRISVNHFKYSDSVTEDDIDYDVDLNLESVAVLLDWHPFKGGFRLSGGAILNGNNVAGRSTSSTGTFDIGNETYTVEEVGTLMVDVTVRNLVPYIGLGWDTSFSKDKGWGFVFELGAVFQGAPKVDLSADGPIASDPTFQSNLAIEEDSLQSDIDVFKYYPVLAIGFSYRF